MTLVKVYNDDVLGVTLICAQLSNKHPHSISEGAFLPIYISLYYHYVYEKRSKSQNRKYSKYISNECYEIVLNIIKNKLSVAHLSCHENGSLNSL